MSERSRRGKYARLICRGCRSRKIKCVLPDVHDLGPLNTPQPTEKACERCRNLHLECVVDYTLLGRPRVNRTHRAKKSEDGSPHTHSDPVPDENLPTLSSLEIKDYLFADDEDNIFSEQCESESSRALRKEEIFESMIQPTSFFISVLSKDRAFGADILHDTSSWTTPLPDLISNDMAESFDKCLVWYYFFLPSMPSLVSLRNRLLSNIPRNINCATRLLFSLLSLAAFDSHGRFSREEWRLKRKLQGAVSFYGQEFMSSPPSHQDSILVALLLSDYKPTALSTMQSVAHKTIKSSMYINIAYGTLHRLQPALEGRDPDLSGLKATDYFEFERCLFDSIKEVHVVVNHATVDGPASQSLTGLQNLVKFLRIRVEAYQNTLLLRQCSPRAIYHIQWATSNYILFQTLIEIKASLTGPRRFVAVVEDTERKCLEQIDYTNSLLATMEHAGNEEIPVARSLLELRFRTIINWTVGLGFLYTSVLGVRPPKGPETMNDADLSCDETIQLTSQVMKSYAAPDRQVNGYLVQYLERFGGVYVLQMMDILERFIECSKMTLNGTNLRPPPRHIGMEIVVFCKNVVENNIVQIKASGHLGPAFQKQMDLFTECAERFASMSSSPELTVEAAFAGGCLYAMCSKIISGLTGLMERLEKKFSKSEENVDLVDAIIASAEYNNSLGIGFNQPSDHPDAWVSSGNFGQINENLPGFLDWSCLLNFDDPGFQPENPFWFGDPFNTTLS